VRKRTSLLTTSLLLLLLMILLASSPAVAEGSGASITLDRTRASIDNSAIAEVTHVYVLVQVGDQTLLVDPLKVAGD